MIVREGNLLVWVGHSCPTTLTSQLAQREPGRVYSCAYKMYLDKS
jgi:hypothetical protein